MTIARQLCLSLVLACAADLAHADGSVTLYGVLDESIQYVRNTGGQRTQIGLQHNNWLVSRLGLKGSEDIGGGNSVVFRLESGFNPNTGALSGSNQIFGRAAYIGIDSARFGQLTFGQHMLLLNSLVGPIQGNWYFGFSAAPGDVDLADGAIKMSNAVQWLSPVWSGLQIGAMYAFGNHAGGAGSDQSYSVAFNYTSGPLRIAAGYIHADNGNPQVSARGTGNASAVFFSPANSAYSSASAYNVMRAGIAYDIGSVTLGGYYSLSDYLPDAWSSFSHPEIYNNVSLYAYWKMSPAWSSEIGVDYMRSHGDSSAIYRTVIVSAGYSLSKTTDLYASIGYGRAFGRNGSGDARAAIGDDWPAAGGASQALAFIGINHRF